MTREKIVKTDDEWRALLDPEQFRVLRRAGTEPAFSGALTDTAEAGAVPLRGVRRRALLLGGQVPFRLRLAELLRAHRA